MLAFKYNQETKEYEETIVDNDCVCLPKDQFAEVPCAYCGNRVPFVGMYASELMTDGGKNAYSICEKCRQKELDILNGNC